MKEKWALIFGLILGGLLGWVGGYLRLPELDSGHAFRIGFVTCLVVLLLALLILRTWKKYATIREWLKVNAAYDGVQQVKRTHTRWGRWTLFILLFIIVFGSVIFRGNRMGIELRSLSQEKKIQRQTALIRSIENDKTGKELRALMDLLRATYRNKGDTVLSASMVAQIAALGNDLEPYRYWQGDSLAGTPLSPERARLLVALVHLNLDSTSWAELKLRTSFAGADLQGVDLVDADLSGVQLKGANLRDARLNRTNLNQADLSGAQFWGADLTAAYLRQANLKRALMNWVKLNDAHLNEADLNGINLSSAQLRNADLSGSTLQWVDLSGALMQGAKFNGVDFLGSNLVKANFSNADFSGADLTRAKINDAVFTGAILDRVIVKEENWLELLDEWHVTGAYDLREQYRLIPDPEGKSKHHLEKIGH